MQGRVHLYEGYSAQQVAFPVRVFARMGVKAVVLTNAAGGINPRYGRGALVVIRDHINLQGQNPLVGPNDDRFGPRFPDMTDAYNPQFRKFALDEAERLGGDIYEGVYAAMLGPSYETPAEIRYLRTIGADLVGMSTVPEVIVARHMGLEVLAISCVTNMAAGMSGEKINHDEVLDTGERVARQVSRLAAGGLATHRAAPRISVCLTAIPLIQPLATGFTLVPHVRQVLSHRHCRSVGSREELSRPSSRQIGCRRRCWRSTITTATSRTFRRKSAAVPTSTIPPHWSTNC